MEHRAFERLRDAAAVTLDPPLYVTRGERLTRWAELLEHEPYRRLRTMHELELKPRSERPSLRVAGSPIAVAFADPLLRASGLAGDTYGDARTFFGLSERQAHRVLCSCLNGPAIEAGRLAVRLRRMASSPHGFSGALVRALNWGMKFLRPLRRAG